MIQLLPMISGNFRGSSEEFRISEVSRCVWAGIKKEQSSRPVYFKIGAPDLPGPFLSQIGLSLHFSVVNWSFKGTSSHLRVRGERKVCRRDLA